MYENYTEISSNYTPNEGRTVMNGQFQHLYNNLTAWSVSTVSYWASGSSGSYSIKTINDSGLDATANYALAEGYATLASGISSHAEGRQTTAGGNYSHAEGYRTVSTGAFSHVEGGYTVATGESAHAEGRSTYAYGNYSHSEGRNTTSIGDYSHAGGNGYSYEYSIISQGTASFNHSYREDATDTVSGTTGNYSAILGGKNNSAIAEGSTVIGGNSCVASGKYSVSSGYGNTASGNYSNSFGYGNTASGGYSTASGYGNTSSNSGSNAEGWDTTASGFYSHSEGAHTTASGNYSHAQGFRTRAIGEGASSKGDSTFATEIFSQTNGFATSTCLFEFGEYLVTVIGSTDSISFDGVKSNYSTGDTVAVYYSSKFHIGVESIRYFVTTVDNVIIIGDTTTVNVIKPGLATTGVVKVVNLSRYGCGYSSAEGMNTAAINISHAEGFSTMATGLASHAGGLGHTGSTVLGVTFAGHWPIIASGTASFNHSTRDYNTSNVSGATGNYSAILGGKNNSTVGESSVVTGGESNMTRSKYSQILGGSGNTIYENSDNCVIIGGLSLTGFSANTTYVYNLNIHNSKTPSSSGDTMGTVGDISWDQNYFYIKTNKNGGGWGRVSLDYNF